jgi:hypothetical protein
MMRCAVLDLGSNSFHLLVADVDGSTVQPVRRQREMLHLGRAVARHGTIPLDLAVRAVVTVERFAEYARRSGAEALVAVGTEALRNSGAKDLVTRLSEAAGTPLSVLDGDEEARLDEILEVERRDDLLAWELGPDTVWRRAVPQRGIDTHATLHERARRRSERPTLRG